MFPYLMRLLIPFGNHFEWLPHCRIPPTAPTPVRTQHHSQGREANCNGVSARCPADAASEAGARSTCRADTPNSSHPLDVSPKPAAADTRWHRLREGEEGALLFFSAGKGQPYLFQKKVSQLLFQTAVVIPP